MSAVPLTKPAQLCRNGDPDRSFRLQTTLWHLSEHGEGQRLPEGGRAAVSVPETDTQLGKGSRQEGRAQTELPHGQRQKVGTAQVRLIRTIKGCQVPDGEPPLISQSISCAGALSPQKKGRSCC